MQVIAIHTITDSAKFWDRAAEGTKALPDGITLQSVAPSQDGRAAICLWEAPDEGAVRQVVEDMVGAFSSNQYFPVDQANAMGLPSGSRR